MQPIPLNIEACLEYLLEKEYRASWEVIDGLEQQPLGLSFIEWLRRNGLLQQGK